MVGAQVREALPQIVRANVKKAKGGSLTHTRWLWSVAGKQLAPAGRGHDSLAALLREQLEKQG